MVFHGWKFGALGTGALRLKKRDSTYSLIPFFHLSCAEKTFGAEAILLSSRREKPFPPGARPVGALLSLYRYLPFASISDRFRASTFFPRQP